MSESILIDTVAVNLLYRSGVNHSDAEWFVINNGLDRYVECDQESMFWMHMSSAEGVAKLKSDLADVEVVDAEVASSLWSSKNNSGTPIAN